MRVKKIGLSLLFLISACMSLNGQINIDGLYGLKNNKGGMPEVFIRFKKDSFELTDQRGIIRFGKGKWEFKDGYLNLSYLPFEKMKSYVSSFSDTPMHKADRILLTILVFDGFDNKKAYKSSAIFIDKSGNEAMSITADTSGKIITSINDYTLFKAVRVNYRGGSHDDSPEFDLSGYRGHNLYLKFFINLKEENIIQDIVEKYKFNFSPMGNMILTDMDGKDLIFTQYSWRYEL